MEELLNKKVVKVELGNEGTNLVFTTDTGELIAYYADADCCSSSWFSHITGIKNLLGHKVIEVKERQEFSEGEQQKAEEEYKKDNTYEPECLALYGIILRTEKGTCDIEFRNESNGYYGGSCEHTTIESTEGFKNITEDF